MYKRQAVCSVRCSWLVLFGAPVTPTRDHALDSVRMSRNLDATTTAVTRSYSCPSVVSCNLASTVTQSCSCCHATLPLLSRNLDPAVTQPCPCRHVTLLLLSRNLAPAATQSCPCCHATLPLLSRNLATTAAPQPAVATRSLRANVIVQRSGACADGSSTTSSGTHAAQPPEKYNQRESNVRPERKIVL